MYTADEALESEILTQLFSPIIYLTSSSKLFIDVAQLRQRFSNALASLFTTKSAETTRLLKRKH